MKLEIKSSNKDPVTYFTEINKDAGFEESVSFDFYYPGYGDHTSFSGYFDPEILKDHLKKCILAIEILFGDTKNE